MNDDFKEELKDCYAEIERLRAALTTARMFIKDEMIAHALVPHGEDGRDSWPSLLEVIDTALGTDNEQVEDRT